MIAELSAAMAAIRETAQLAKLINDAKTETEVNAAVSELNSKLASIQRECISLVELVDSYQEINASLKAKMAICNLGLEFIYTDPEAILCPNLSSGWISLSLVHHHNQSLVGN